MYKTGAVRVKVDTIMMQPVVDERVFILDAWRARIIISCARGFVGYYLDNSPLENCGIPDPIGSGGRYLDLTFGGLTMGREKVPVNLNHQLKLRSDGAGATDIYIVFQREYFDRNLPNLQA